MNILFVNFGWTSVTLSVWEENTITLVCRTTTYDTSKVNNLLMDYLNWWQVSKIEADAQSANHDYVSRFHALLSEVSEYLVNSNYDFSIDLEGNVKYLKS